MLTHMAPLLTRMARMARLLTRMARMLTRMTRWLAGSHIIHTLLLVLVQFFTEHPHFFFIWDLTLSPWGGLMSMQ